jgi:TRAP-type C4-dicarboxylate transport system permease small subunit
MIGYTTYRPPKASSALRPLAAAIAALDVAASWTIVVLLSAMVAVVSAQVFLRYAFNSSLGWADEISRLTFVWTIFLAIPLGIKAGVHIGMEILTQRLPLSLQDSLARLMAAAGAGLMLLVAWQSALLATDQWDELMASADASASWFIVPLVLGCAHSALHLLWITLTGKHKPEADMTDVATE